MGSLTTFFSNILGTSNVVICSDCYADVVVYCSEITAFNKNTLIQIKPNECAVFLKTNSLGKTESCVIDESNVANAHNMPFFKQLSEDLHRKKSQCLVYFVYVGELIGLHLATPCQLGPFEDAQHYYSKSCPQVPFLQRLLTLRL